MSKDIYIYFHTGFVYTFDSIKLTGHEICSLLNTSLILFRLSTANGSLLMHAVNHSEVHFLKWKIQIILIMMMAMNCINIVLLSYQTGCTGSQEVIGNNYLGTIPAVNTVGYLALLLHGHDHIQSHKMNKPTFFFLSSPLEFIESYAKASMASLQTWYPFFCKNIKKISVGLSDMQMHRSINYSTTTKPERGNNNLQ